MPRPDRWLVVLARDARRAKSRLADVLTAGERARLALAMLEDVLEATLGAGARVVVATESAAMADLARRHGAEPLAVPARGTREAARDALAAAAEARARLAGVLPADLPALRTDDVVALLDAAEAADVVLASDRHGRGTNALVLRPPLALEPLFGPDSFAAHRDAAARAGLRVRTVTRPGLALDVDDAADLAAARETVPTLGARTARFLAALAAVGD
ncbi:MAG: 2-phospho-L-lactate guanylyltransferase [Chloroflexota bacterium]|nr:2-phospho-L-lactate guanylyltransferase [Chloroflexota bacterium]